MPCSSQCINLTTANNVLCFGHCGDHQAFWTMFCSTACRQCQHMKRGCVKLNTEWVLFLSPFSFVPVKITLPVPSFIFKVLPLLFLSNGKERWKRCGAILPSFSYRSSMGGLGHRTPHYSTNLLLEANLFTVMHGLCPVLTLSQHLVLMHMIFLISETFGFIILRHKHQMSFWKCMIHLEIFSIA